MDPLPRPASGRSQPIERRFFSRPTLTVARALLGCHLCHWIDGRLLRGRIVEAEAYTDDPASHARHARRTPRNRVMFGPPGHAYVYFTYGMHFCFNIVTESDGVPGAVLVRGLDRLEGANGPARLCRVLQIAGMLNGADLTLGKPLWLEGGRRRRAERVIQTTRVGIRDARHLPWRFYLAGSPGVSRRDSAAERAHAPRATQPSHA